MSRIIGLYPVLSPGPQVNGFPDAFLAAVSEVCGCSYTPFFTGRSALLAGLASLGMTRMDEIMVPPYLGQCVLSAVSHTSFPTHAPGERTRALLVLHQFGFPQKLAGVEAVARERGWRIVNNCAHALYAPPEVALWGDVTVCSFSKFFACGFGGGLRMAPGTELPAPLFGGEDALFAGAAYQDYAGCMHCDDPARRSRDIHALFGYLPFLRTFPAAAASLLPSTAQALRADRDRRAHAFELALELFPQLGEIGAPGLAPMAIPVPGPESVLARASDAIWLRLGVEAPVLHFDFARNVLQPDYRAALMVGCHAGWSTETIGKALEIARGML
ncbi:MAG: hypothetical protein V3571_04235 [Pseudodesulfovibrio sp.]